MKRYQYTIFLLLLAALSRSYAQSVDAPPGNQAIRMIANPKENKITLRWAPTTPSAWEYANRYGYSLQRLTLIRGNRLLNNHEKILLKQNITPLPLADWEAEVKRNKYAAVAAQALYGKKFQVSQQSSDLMQVVNQVKESEQRFSFALFAADYSPVVADMSGLSFTDDRVSQDENYLYKIWVNMPDNKITIDTGFVYVGLRDQRALPVPQKPEIKFMDKAAIISWNYAYHARTYIAYIVERSVAGENNFIPITKDPVIPAENTPNPGGVIHVMDTLTNNSIGYAYRIKGITAFGETGPASQLLEGHGKKALSAAPAIRKVTVQDNKQVELQWEYPATLSGELTGFLVERAFHSKGPFESVSSVLKPELTIYTDNNPGSSNYYRVVALGAEDRSYSFPHLAQLLDSIPPATPVNITTSIDTSGVVILKWETGKENDLLGYRVYRSNFDSHEYRQVTVSPLSDPVFYDTVNLKTLTRNVYYKVVAVDHHFNPSDFSAAVAVERPDILPPATPAFTNIEYKRDTGIVLNWMASSSTDIKHHLLYRRTASDNTWRLTRVIPASDSSMLTDIEVRNKNAYEYILVAVDESGLESKPSIPVRISVNDRGNKPVVNKFSVKPDKDKKLIQLSWTYDAPDVRQFRIYRKGEDGRMRLFESVPGSVLQFSDRQLTINTQYEYSIQAVFMDGAHSPFSKTVKVLY